MFDDILAEFQKSTNKFAKSKNNDLYKRKRDRWVDASLQQVVNVSGWWLIVPHDLQISCLYKFSFFKFSWKSFRKKPTYLCNKAICNMMGGKSIDLLSLFVWNAVSQVSIQHFESCGCEQKLHVNNPIYKWIDLICSIAKYCQTSGNFIDEDFKMNFRITVRKEGGKHSHKFWTSEWLILMQGGG